MKSYMQTYPFLFEKGELREATGNKKKKKKKPEAKPEPVSAPVLNEEKHAPRLTLDGIYECSRCQAQYWDIESENAGYWNLYCIFCGWTAREVVVDHAVILNSEEKFVMPSGIHKGRSLDKIAHLEGGLKYIEFIGKKPPNKLVEKEIKTWLATNKAHQ
jgi:hypothetical protein